MGANFANTEIQLRGVPIADSKFNVFWKFYHHHRYQYFFRQNVML